MSYAHTQHRLIGRLWENKLFPRNQPLLNQELRQCVSLRQAGDEKFLHCDWSFIWFCHCAPYLITLSARASTLGGIVRPICFAAFRLMMNSNFFGCSTGRSAGVCTFWLFLKASAGARE